MVCTIVCVALCAICVSLTVFEAMSVFGRQHKLQMIWHECDNDTRIRR